MTSPTPDRIQITADVALPALLSMQILVPSLYDEDHEIANGHLYAIGADYA